MSIVEELYKRHKHWVQVVKNMGELEFAEDFVQECYIKLMANVDKLDANKSVNNYFHTMLVNMVKTYKKSKKNLDKTEYKEEEHAIADTDYSEEFLEPLEELTEFIDTLEWYDRKLYLIWAKEGISIRKLARETGLPFSNVYYSIRASKEKVKQYIANNPKLKETYNTKQ